MLAACSPAGSAPEPTPNATVEALTAQLAQLQAAPTATVPPTPAPSATPVDPEATPTAAPTTVASPAALPLEDAAAIVKRYTVYLWTDIGSGSGISLGGGHVLTNYHVVRGATEVSARFADGRQEPVHVIRTDARRDLALIQASFSDVPGAPIRDARGLRDGELLIAVGFPRSDAIGAQESTVTRGIVSGRWQSPQGVWHVQTDTPVNPGNSGGPLADSQGRVVGVVTFGVRDAVGLNFALSSDEVQAFLNASAASPEDMTATGVPFAAPELTTTTLSPRVADPGALITLEYEITYHGDPLPLILGASVRLPGGAWISDPAGDVQVTLRPGRSSYTRQLRLPPTSAPGAYDVAWGLLGTDGQTSYGLVTQPGALTIRGLPPALPVSGALAAAVARVAQAGYRVSDTSSYDPYAPIRVLIGVLASAADGANQRAFFFAGERYLGTDALDPSAGVQFVRQTGNVITLRYVIYRPSDSMCCPSGGTVDVRYRWDGASLTPLDPIPASDTRAIASRR